MSDDERRARFRCATADEQQVVIRRGQRDLPGRLVDQSADGFAIAARIRARVGQQLLLRSHLGWSEVEVVRYERKGREAELGLKRIRDLADPRDRTRNSWVIFPSKASARPETRVGPFLILSMMAVLGFWVYVAFTAYRHSQ